MPSSHSVIQSVSRQNSLVMDGDDGRDDDGHGGGEATIYLIGGRVMIHRHTIQ